MKRQKIKRYRFSVTQNTRRRRAARPLKAVGVVLVCLCLLTGVAFGVYKAIQSKTTGWHGEGLHRYYISPTTGTRAQGLYEINYKLYYFDQQQLFEDRLGSKRTAMSAMPTQMESSPRAKRR